MLTQIFIKNFLLIDSLSLDFTSGMTTLTGETGAGKSILLDALGLALGERANSEQVRQGSNKAEIIATFQLHDSPIAQKWLTETDLDDEEECILRRVVSRDGKSKAFINNRPVPTSQLKSLGNLLLEIHGQHANQHFLQSGLQRQLIDDYASHGKLTNSVAEHFTAWKSAKESLDTLLNKGKERKDRLDILEYQLNELREIDAENTDFDQLNSECTRLANAEKLITGIQTATNLLSYDEINIERLLTQTIGQLTELARYDDKLNGKVSIAEECSIQLSELSADLQSMLSRFDADENRIDDIQQKIAQAQALARKHHVPLTELQSTYKLLSDEHYSLENFELETADLERKVTELNVLYIDAAKKLSASRIKHAKKFSKTVTEIVRTLGMKSAELSVKIESDIDKQPTKYGIDEINFLFTANPGSAPALLKKVASGGELARLSLAIQVVASNINGTPTLIFDEVDTGIGGAIAQVVGQQMRQLASDKQVLCVTHLPQVAAQAHNHLHVSKAATKKTTVTSIETLDQKSRIDEIARMLGGVEITESTLTHAEEMLNASSKRVVN